MNRKDITNREDVYVLVSTFYSKIKQDDFIGPIFLKVIPNEKWELHLQKLTDFWQSNLFFNRKYKGDPMKAHKDVDNSFNHTISKAHFERWLSIWVDTVDALFLGIKASEAKERARNIANLLLIKIYEAR
ncbi:MAG: group III truncated hemoglobin [Flavobacteriaceae bacterium]